MISENNFQTISNTTRPETEVGLRTVKGGLRGQESGAWGRRMGQNRVSPILKKGANGLVGCGHIQCFVGVETEFHSEKRKENGSTLRRR